MTKFNQSFLNNKHLLVFAGKVFAMVIAFATSYLLFHYVSQEALGMWFFVQSIVTLFVSVRTGFLSNATVAFYAGAASERGANVLGSVWFLALALSAIIMAINAIAFPLLPFIDNVEVILCIKWVGITYLSTLPSDIALWRMQADEKYSTMLWFRMMSSIFILIVLIMLIVFHSVTLENILRWNVIANIIASGVALSLRMTGIQYIFRRSKACISELFHYGKYSLGTTSLSIFLGNIDTWMINGFLGASALAVYNLALRFMSVTELLMGTFLTTGMSEMAIAYNQGNMQQVTYFFKKYAGILTWIFIPMILGVLLMADIPINFLGGAKYHGSIAANAFRFYMVLALLYPFDRFTGVALDVTRQTKINLYKMIIMLVATIGGDAAGLLMFGNIYGIAFSGLIVIIAAVLFGNYQLRKTMDYTISGIMSTGLQELKAMLSRKKEN